MTTPVVDRLDSIALELLDVLVAIHLCRKGAHKLLENGHLSLSQARYSRGVKSVSSLQFPSEMSAAATTSVHNDENGIQIMLHQMTTESVTLTPNLTESDPPTEDTQLRHRKGHAKETRVETVSAKKEAKKEEKVARATYSDPLKWFGVLVPLSLRSAKKSFSEGVEMIVELANLQIKLECLRTEYGQLLKKKAEMKGD
ncbi:coiled-coil domain-containing protein 115-like [Corticium candelabrum]|uniref:coiled-coil domain-containing protein 115-like n=1 Tax=Corticium candelabrum TaxID=121492 RepID=UPI002E26E0FA|nr:coiled-coil domain-containing protein 115-like [Corticium candelabrum]